ncbi:MAG TPA: BON domain-containing protein [Steroidobacteraceae bacterium]|nr:BON domain-containing protein [Steroidobacteraceae bacterium]
MSNDNQLRRDVEAELEWDTRIDARRIGVAVKDGVVTLSGNVGSYFERQAALDAVQAVDGVLAVANDVVVVLPDDVTRSDTDIAESAAAALQLNTMLPSAAIRLSVRDGWITLVGEVNNWHQKHVAELALTSLRGVRGMSNLLTIRASHAAQDVQGLITSALKRAARLDAERIKVQHDEDGTVTLEGDVGSLHERNVAEIAAWQAPGVSRVVDKLRIRPQ